MHQEIVDCQRIDQRPGKMLRQLYPKICTSNQKINHMILPTHHSYHLTINHHLKLQQPMRNSNSRDKHTSSNTYANRNTHTQIKKATNYLENTNLNVAPSSRKSDRKHQLPPKPQNKVSYDVEVNMTESKIFQAKQGLQLLKKKMTRTGMSRQKSHSTADKIDQNVCQPLVIKQMISTQLRKKQVSFKKAKQPSKMSRQNQLSAAEAKTVQFAKVTKRQAEQEVNNMHDDKPICKQVNFMNLLEREMQKEANTIGKGGDKLKKEINKIYNQHGEEIILHECTMGCGRMFNPDIIQKHQKICQKVFQSKRKAFDSSQHRQIQGQNYQKSTVKKIEQNPKPKNEVPKWKLESARLRAGLKLGKNQALSKEEEQVMEVEVDVLKVCNFCGRKFNEKAAEKHIPFCERKSKEIGKNSRPR